MKIKSTIWNGRDHAKYAHVKIDGNFTRIVKNEFGSISVYSSIDTDLTYAVRQCRPKWLALLQKNMPLNSTVLGEIYYYNVEKKCGLPASYIKTGLANSENYFSKNGSHYTRNVVISGCSTNQLCFSAFAIENLPNDAPLEVVQTEFLKYSGGIVHFAPYIKLVWSIESGETFLSLYNKERLLTHHLNICRARKDCKGLLEGFVLKDGNLINWMKVKESKTIDCFITGYTNGEGKYYGQVGSLLVSVYRKAEDNTGEKIIEIGKVSGFNDEIRLWLTKMFKENQDEILNEVIEVKYQNVASQGRLRHCVFVNWREDKLATECFVDQDEELSRFYNA